MTDEEEFAEDMMKTGLHKYFLKEIPMYAQDYIHNVLEPVALPYILQLENLIFAQENTNIHKAAVTTRFVRDPQVIFILWSARSPEDWIGLISWLNKEIAWPITQN